MSPDDKRVLKHGIGYDLILGKERMNKFTRYVLGIKCHTCERISFHPKDIDERYCGYCHVFHEDGRLSQEG